MEKEEIIDLNSRKIEKLILITLIINLLLAFGKLFGGIFSFSKSLISDSVNSFGDVVTSLIAIIGVRIGRKKPDKNHPYGHQKIESIFVIIFEMVVLFSAGIIAFTSIQALCEFTSSKVALEIPTKDAIIVAACCIFIKLCLFIYALVIYKKTKNVTAKAQLFDHAFDAFGTTISTICLAIAIKFNIVWLDSAISLLFVLLISYNSIKQIIENVNNIIDHSWEDENQIIDFLKKYKEILAVDVLKTRKFGQRVYVDLEVQMDKNLSLLKSHEIVDKIEKDLEEKFIDIIHVNIHVNPN